MYAKLVDGNLAYATNPLRIGTRHVYTTDPTPYGYKQVVRDAPTPPDGYMAVHDGWRETDTQIVETYRMEPEFVAEGNIPAGTYFEADGRWYRALRAIARGEEVTEGINAQAADLAEIINAINDNEKDSEE